MVNRGWVIARVIAGCALLLVGAGGCASGPHPVLKRAAKDFDCPMESLTRHQIYPNKQRVEGCGKNAVYVKTCGGGYGLDSDCGWAKAAPGR